MATGDNKGTLSKNGKAKSLNEKIVVFTVIAIFMATFLYYFMKQDSKLSDIGLYSAATAFSSKLTIIHSQWFMDKKPDVVVLRSLNSSENKKNDHQEIPVNSNGWVDITADSANSANQKVMPCQIIWQYLLEGPLKVINEPIAAIEIKNSAEHNYRVCRYQMVNGAFFEYSSINGKVSDVVNVMN